LRKDTDMTNLKKNILRVMPRDSTLTAVEIAQAVTAHRDMVQEALHELDDEGLMIMRGGHYRLSSVALAEKEAER